jgi:hypothetical protein
VLFLSVTAIQTLTKFIYKLTCRNSGDDGDEGNNRPNSGHLLECFSTAEAYKMHAWIQNKKKEKAETKRQ